MFLVEIDHTFCILKTHNAVIVAFATIVHITFGLSFFLVIFVEYVCIEIFTHFGIYYIKLIDEQLTHVCATTEVFLKECVNSLISPVMLVVQFLQHIQNLTNAT